MPCADAVPCPVPCPVRPGTTPRLLLWPPHLLLLLALAALAALLGLLPLRRLPPAAQLACCAAFGAAAALCGCGALLPLERSRAYLIRWC